MAKIRIGLNGFGRIGRALFRVSLESADAEIVIVNELDSDIANLAYLLKYDSLYGRLPQDISLDGAFFKVQDQRIPVTSITEIEKVPWSKHLVDVVIDATGVRANADNSHALVASGAVSKVVISNSYEQADAIIIFGANESIYQPKAHHVISSSICDANGVAPVLNLVDRTWGVEAAFITTLHPWLSYQNLLDGPVSSVASPGHSWADYSLGRASVLSLIPKDTTAAKAISSVLPNLRKKVDAISFRVPTHIVSAADLSIQTVRPLSVREVHEKFCEMVRDYKKALAFESEPLVSSDYLKTVQSCILDGRRTRVIGGRFLKLVTWYDNEWGYANRILDTARLVSGRLG